ncbi:MAG: MarR family winged helix-turn-helix transcriptional regulator [Anaeroplasmataceae bacterium]
MGNRFEDFTSLIANINKSINKIKGYYMNKFGLKSIHAMCLFYLNHYENVTNTMLVNLTKEDKAAISRALDLLEEKQYILCDKKYKSPIKLLPEGKKVADFIDSASSDAVAFASKSYTEEERVLLYKMLDSININLSDYINGMRSE